MAQQNYYGFLSADFDKHQKVFNVDTKFYILEDQQAVVKVIEKEVH